MGRINRVQQKACVGAHNLKVEPGADLVCLFDVKLERAADSGIEQTETVLAWLDLEVWPRLSVDMDDIAEKIGRLAVGFRAPEAAVRVVPLGGQTERNIVVCSLWETSNLLFFIIVKDVEP